MRQHGQRDHTVFSYYGSEQEQWLQALVRLRTALQPYLQTELTKLSEGGRPFNRPLNYDFPTDPKTWELAEKGLGVQNDDPVPGGRPPQPGDFLAIVPCSEAPEMALNLTAPDNTIRLTKQPNLCVDSATLSLACGFKRQCVGAIWPCTNSSIDTDTDTDTDINISTTGSDVISQAPAPTSARVALAEGAPVVAAAAQTWSRGTGNQNMTLRNTRDAGFVGSAGGAPSGGTNCLMGLNSKQGTGFASINGCGGNRLADQEWTPTTDGKIGLGNKAAVADEHAVCLGTVPPPQVVGLDQYMVGDDMMAAPVLAANVRKRAVYFPVGATWTHHYTGVVYQGGTTAVVPAPLEHFPLFHRGPA
jgi:hypothetical protein